MTDRTEVNETAEKLTHKKSRLQLKIEIDFTVFTNFTR